MKRLIQEYSFVILTILFGIMGVWHLVTQTINKEIPNDIKITESTIERGYIERWNKIPDIVLEAKQEEIIICYGDEIDPKEYINAYYNNNENSVDLSSYVIAPTVDGNITPGKYKLEYALHFENEYKTLQVTLIIEDKNKNNACPIEYVKTVDKEKEEAGE